MWNEAIVAECNLPYQLLPNAVYVTNYCQKESYHSQRKVSGLRFGEDMNESIVKHSAT
jgi:hypothetical protein